jgi:hypothetical protein
MHFAQEWLPSPKDRRGKSKLYLHPFVQVQLEALRRGHTLRRGDSGLVVLGPRRSLLFRGDVADAAHTA